MTEKHLVILNPAAGGGRCAKIAGGGVARLRELGIALDVEETHAPGDASRIAREAYAAGTRHFVAAGGDGTTYEVLNGLFPAALHDSERPKLGLLPAGTGNSFLRDFTNQGYEYALWSIAQGKRRICDIARLAHRDGELFYINILSMGFVADVCALRNNRLSAFGEFGYVLGVFAEVSRLRQEPFNMRIDDQTDDRAPLTFISFNNSRFTGGKMMMAPDADPTDAKIDYIRVGQMGRLALLRTFPKIFSGTHLLHPAVSSRRIEHVDFELEREVDVMVDGEVLRVVPRRLEVVPGAVEVMV
ncbi:MAG: diacylglycerol kinase family lipid kinase [Myxococcales bacterium]|nr:diacylglycerol kinase family lipid kinase [Myxococcales bacterium]